jgi:Uma2 family endonuclease
VAESSLSIDRGIKLRLYATCGVPEYWIVNLSERVIEAYSEPADGAYGKVNRCEHGQGLRPILFADVEVRISDVMRSF